MPDLAEQHLVAAEAEDVADPVALQPAHGLGPGIVAVAADQDVDGGPTAANGPDDMAQDEGHLGTVRRLAGPQDDRDRLAGGGLIDVDRQEAAAVVVGMKQRQLLAAMDAILGVVDVEHDAARDLGEARAEQIDHGRHHPLQRGCGRQVLEPGHGRLRAQFGSGLRQAADGHLEGGVAPQGVAVVGVLVAGGDHQRAEADHLGEAMADPLGCARVLDAACQPVGDAELALTARRARVRTGQRIGVSQNVLAADLVVEQVEAERRLRLRLAIQLPLKGPDLLGCCQAHRQSPVLAVVESTPEVRALPSTGVTRLPQYYGPVRLPPEPPPEAPSRPRPSSNAGLPRYPIHLSGVPCPLPRRIGRVLMSIASPSVQPSRIQAGRHPRLHFRGLLRLHSRYGPSDRSTAQGGLCHEASARPVTQPNRSSATRPIDNYLGGSFLHW